MKLCEAFAEIRVDDRRLKTGLAGSIESSKRAASRIQRAFSVINFRNLLVGTFGIYALQRALKTIISPAVAFESQLAMVSTMLDKTAMDILPKYNKELRSLSIEFGESTETLSKGLYDILSASVAPTKALGVLEASAKAATAGITDTGVAADAITTIINAYGMAAEDAGSISDFLFAVVKRGKTTFAELAPAIGKVAATAAIAGLELEELGATIATLTRAGIRTDEAMTAVTGVIVGFLKPTEDAKKAAEDFGIELSTNTLRTMGLKDVIIKLGEASAEQLAAMFPNIRGLKGMAAALQSAESWAEDYNLMLNRLGLTEEAYSKRIMTTEYQLGRVSALWNEFKVLLGTELLPLVGDIAKRILGWYTANEELIRTDVKTWGEGLATVLYNIAVNLERIGIAMKAIGLAQVGKGWGEIGGLLTDIEFLLRGWVREEYERERIRLLGLPPPEIVPPTYFERGLGAKKERGFAPLPPIGMARPRIPYTLLVPSDEERKLMEERELIWMRGYKSLEDTARGTTEFMMNLNKRRLDSEQRLAQNVKNIWEEQKVTHLVHIETMEEKWKNMQQNIIDSFPDMVYRWRNFSYDILNSWTQSLDIMSGKTRSFADLVRNLLLDVARAISREIATRMAQRLYQEAIETIPVGWGMKWFGGTPTTPTIGEEMMGDISPYSAPKKAINVNLSDTSSDRIRGIILDDMENYGLNY